MNELQIFNHPDFGQVRAITINDEPYVVGKDVAQVLGYQNPSKAIIDHVDDEDKCFSMLQWLFPDFRFVSNRDFFNLSDSSLFLLT